MKLLLENWRKYLDEAEGGIKGSARQAKKTKLRIAKNLLSKNKFLQKYAKNLKSTNLVDAGGKYIFLNLDGTFEHAKFSHSRESDIPGSKFNDTFRSDQALTNLVVDIMQNEKPSEIDRSPYGTKIKWFSIDTGQEIGLDSLISQDDPKLSGKQSSIFDFKEPIRNNAAIPSLLDQGLKIFDEEGNELQGEPDPNKKYLSQQDVAIIDAPLQPTQLVNLIVADLGRIGSRKLVSLMTVFPGIMEPTARNKKDYADLGYYFVTGK